MRTLWYGDGPGAPRTAPRDVLAAAGHDPSPDCDAWQTTLGWTLERLPWLDDPDFRARSVMSGYAQAAGLAEGRITAIPIRLPRVPTMIAESPPDVAVVTGVRRGEGFAFNSAVGWADVLTRHAARVVVELADHDAAFSGAPPTPSIEGNIVATIPRPTLADAPSSTSRPADHIDLAIGALVADLIPHGATLEFGPGGIAEGIARAIDRPVSIWTGLVTDVVASLHERQLLVGPVMATYAWGGAALNTLAAAGMLQLVSCTTINDAASVAAIPRFVACNTALQVGLDGSVNVERVGGRQVAAIGGHSDFCAGASRSIGGLSVIALRSTTNKGASTIVPRVEVVSTQRSDIDVVVTEHGVADLRGLDDAQRAQRLIAIAAPQHRQQLAEASDHAAIS